VRGSSCRWRTARSLGGSRQGRQARSRPKRPVGTLLRAMEFLRSVLSDGSGVDRATQSDPVPAPERSSHFARPNGLHRRVGKKSHPGYRSHSSFVDGRDARLVIVRLPSGGDQCRARPPSLRKRWAETRTGQQGRMRKGSVQTELTSTHSRSNERSSVGRQARHAHGARGFHHPKPVVERLARPASSARNPRRGSTGRRRRDNVCKNS